MPRRPTLILSFSAILVAVFIWFWFQRDRTAAGHGATTPSTPSEKARPDPWQALAELAADADKPPGVDIDFTDTPLPVVLDELVKKTGLTVIADLEPAHDKMAVTLHAFLAPLDALKLVSLEYGLELQETGEGWWLRPIPAAVEVIYQPTLLTMDDDRAARLVQSLREIIGAPAAAVSSKREAVCIATDGIHVITSIENQTRVSSWLDVFFREKVASKNPGRLQSIPSLPQRR